MMKRFIYFRTTDGGMEWKECSSVEDIKYFLYGWMSESCQAQDLALLVWQNNADIGEWKEHRLGVLVRVTDGE